MGYVGVYFTSYQFYVYSLSVFFVFVDVLFYPFFLLCMAALSAFLEAEQIRSDNDQLGRNM